MPLNILELSTNIAAFSEGISNPPVNCSTIDLGELGSGLELSFFGYSGRVFILGVSLD
jgi:hypothetical protein